MSLLYEGTPNNPTDSKTEAPDHTGDLPADFQLEIVETDTTSPLLGLGESRVGTTTDIMDRVVGTPDAPSTDVQVPEIAPVPDDTNSNKWLKRIGFPLAGVALATGAFIGYKAWHAKDTGPTHSVSGVENPGTGPEKPVEKLLTIVEPDGTEAKLSANAQELLTYGTLTKETAGQWFTGFEKLHTTFKYWEDPYDEGAWDVLDTGTKSLSGLFTSSWVEAAKGSFENEEDGNVIDQITSVAGQIEMDMGYTFTFGKPKIQIQGNTATYVVDVHQHGSFSSPGFDREYTYTVDFKSGQAEDGRDILLGSSLHSHY